MRYSQHSFKVDDYLLLFPIGDVHFGAKDCDVKLFEDHLKMIQKTPNSAVILTGDLCNIGLHDSAGAGCFDDEYNPHEQYDRLIKYLSPLKDKIIAALVGNHEERIRNKTSFDITKLLCVELKCDYLGYGGMLRLLVNTVPYHIYATHGSGGGRTIAGKMKRCWDMQFNAQADLYLHAHVHALNHYPKNYFKIDNQRRCLVEETRHFVLTGSFLKWDGSYGEKKGFQSMQPGIPKIKLFGNLSRGKKKIEVRFSDK